MAEDKGGLRERWQYRQEMKAHGAWGHWGLPTRDDYTEFHDARNLADLVKTWRPHNIEAYGLGEHGLRPLIQAEKEEAFALLDKRVESGLSEAEVRTYAQLVNRWQAEHRMLVGEEDHYRPYEQTRTALQEALGETLALLHEHHPHSAEFMEVQAEAAELRQALQALDRQPVDVSTAQTTPLEEDMQSLKARMEALDGLRAVVIASGIADLLEEAQRQGLVETGQEVLPETHALKQQKRMGY